MFNVVGIAMVKNESDIIEAFVRHNMHYLDAMIILENNSDDSTRDILLALQGEGYPIVIFDDPIFGYYQSEKITYAFKRVAKVFNPNYVVFLDADEFIIASSRELFLSEIQSLPAGSQGIYHWITYIPSPELIGTGDPIRDIVHRRKVEEPRIAKAILPCHPQINDKIVVGRGAHSIDMNDKPLTAIELNQISLAHFPVRSVRQIAKKAINGWRAMLKNSHRGKHTGYQWERLHNKILNNNALSKEDLLTEALNYVQNKPAVWPYDVVYDPLCPLYNNLRYSENNPGRVDISDIVMGSNLRPAKKEYIFERYNISGSQTDIAGQGSFFENWHQQNLFFDIPPFQHIAELYKPKSVLDLGCGLGTYLSYFSQSGSKKVLGVDGFPMKQGFLREDQYLQHDLSKVLNLNEKFDLVICTEVIEHLPPDKAFQLIETIIGHAGNNIVFSAGQFGQPGDGHINLRPIEYWLHEFSKRGWNPDLFDTLAIRSLATFSWLQRNLIVLKYGPGLLIEDFKHLCLVSKHIGSWFPEPIKKVSHPLATLAQNLALKRMSNEL